MNNWERCYSNEGCPYYLHLKTRKTQWEHPYFAQILADADEYNEVIYAAYRTALKLLHIRNNLHLQSLKVERIALAFSDVFPAHNVKTDEYLTLSQLDEILAKLYCYCDTSLSQDVWAGAVGSCLLFFFDGKRRGTVNTLSVLVLLTTLCSDNLTAKYSFIFSCFNEHDLVGAPDITHLKRIVFMVLSKIKEERAFKNAYEGHGTTMTEDMFITWLFSEPKFMVWLSTIHRIHAASSVRHEVKCYICKDYPIVGLRYRCLQCFNVDICFQCFTRVPTYGKHDKSHAIEEFCVQSNKIQDMKAFFTIVRNRLKKKSKSSKPVVPEVQLTARRQPATIWHDPKLQQNLYTTDIDVPNDGIANILPAPPSTLQRAVAHSAGLYSPNVNRLKSQSRTSTLDEYNSLLHGYTAFTTKDGSNVYRDRLCEEMLSRGRPASCEQQDPQVANNFCNYKFYRTTLPKTPLVNRSNPPVHFNPLTQETNYVGSSRINRLAERSARNSPMKGPASMRHVPRYHSTPQYTPHPRHSATYTRPLYAVQKHRDLNRDLCTPVEARGTPREQYNSISVQPGQSTVRSYAACSEDEGIVLNSESDESSQYATLTMTRFTEPLTVETGHSIADSHNRNFEHTNGEFDYTKYAWDHTNQTKQSVDPSFTYDHTGYHTVDFSNDDDKLDTSRDKEDLYQAVNGIRQAMSPLVRRYKS